MWSNISPGSKIAVVAPAGPVPADRYRAGLEILAARYTLVHVYDPAAAGPLPYLAGTDQQRSEALNRALRDPQVEAIFCARGGYGSLRILEALDGEALRRRRPALVGFSDVTALHAWAARLGVPTLHGPVVTQLARLPAAEVEALFAALEGRGLPTLTGLQPAVGGRARGPLRGGNLTMLSHLCGTPWQPDVRGAILLLEEIGEAPYRLDRMLTQLRLARALEGVAGIVVGTLLDCDAPQGPTAALVEARSVVVERLAGLGVPLVLGAPVGHGDHNLALPMGGPPARLDADQGRLDFDRED